MTHDSETPKRRPLGLIFVFACLICGAQAMAASPPPLTRSVSGTVSLDRGVADQNYSVNVEVNEHTIVVLPIPFGIIYPVVGTNSTTVTIAKGRYSTAFRVNGVPTVGIKFAIRVRCDQCGPVIQTQYVGAEQMFTGFTPAVLFNSDQLPTQINIGLLTNNTLEGSIILPPGQTAPRTLNFQVMLLGSTNVLHSTHTAMLPGQASTNYKIQDISRFGEGSVQVVAVCSNCAGVYRARQVYPALVNTASNQDGIDFYFQEARLNTGAIMLLLDQPD